MKLMMEQGLVHVFNLDLGTHAQSLKAAVMFQEQF